MTYFKIIGGVIVLGLVITAVRKWHRHLLDRFISGESRHLAMRMPGEPWEAFNIPRQQGIIRVPIDTATGWGDWGNEGHKIQLVQDGISGKWHMRAPFIKGQATINEDFFDDAVLVARTAGQLPLVGRISRGNSVKKPPLQVTVSRPLLDRRKKSRIYSQAGDTEILPPVKDPDRD